MKVKVLCIGKTDEPAVNNWIDTYKKRLPNYLPLEIVEIPDLKNVKKLSSKEQKKKEAELLLSKLTQTDFVILMDENGKQFTSVEFANQFQKWMNQSIKQIVFCIGGPYGFDVNIKQRANQSVSFSKMTFTHQMIRVFLCEQIYRATTILDGKPYHNE